ncbi:DNA repair protein RecO [Flavobacterium sp.]|jgi:DNA repair protein RecO (recombination protein O)|uniref:DNA repair protein RecO n=1 Tax=Flavobacterium sp. TaxID=239 RepID=UPI002A7FC453|nr:DNA repair protein RecO [Flavobacterium sp.]
MQIKTKAIVISTVKFQEKSLIVKCFTQSNGIKSYFVNNAFTGKNNKQKIAFFQPLMQLEIEATNKNKGTLERFKDIKIAIPYQTISYDIYKTTIVLFLSEFLNHAIKEEEANEALFEYLEAALLWLDNHNEISNFHLIVLIQITKYLGFYPENPSESIDYFDQLEGVFNNAPSSSSLSVDETNLLKKLLVLKLDNIENSFSANQRQILLKIIINYFTLNVEGFKTPKSVEVFKEVFS